MITKFRNALFLGVLLTAGSAGAADGHERGDRGDRGDREDRHGGFMSVPELNAKTGGAALALVLGGAAVVLGRRKRSAPAK
jgi:hypothetical protein